MACPSLAALLNADNPDGFLSAFWPHRLFRAQGPTERLAGLIELDLDGLIDMKEIDASAYRCADGRTVSIRADRKQLRPLYAAGFTLYFDHLHSPGIDEWVRVLEEELGLVRGASVVTAFASPPGDGLTPHFDANDNFICQARGVKRWRVAENTHIRYPTSGHLIGRKPRAEQLVEAPNGFPSEMPPPTEIFDLTPGSVMFMPRGMWHTPETIGQESLHFNIRVTLPSWRDLIEFLLRNSAGDWFDDLRAPLTGAFKGGKLSSEIEERLRGKIRELAARIGELPMTLSRERVDEFLVQRRKSS